MAVAKIVGKKKKNNVILIGPAGAGKTAIIELLAQRIINQTAPVTLLDKRIIELDIPLMHAGASMAGQLEKRMKSVLNELARDVNKNVVLFIDEVHLLTSGGGTGRIDLANIMKPAMARGELCLIAATTFDEYREHIETDKALKRRFEEVVVNEATVAETITILQQVRGTYEKFHNVTYSDTVIDTIVDYANRFVTDRHFPDKALDIMDSLGALKKLDSGVSKNESTLRVELDAVAQKKREALRNTEFVLAADLNAKQQELQYKVDNLKSLYQDIPRQEVTLDDVATIVSNRTGIPITKVSTTQADVINSLEENLKASIIGQDDAIQTVVKAVRRSKAGLSNPDRPMGTLLFLGPTGVGKTEIVKQLAKNLFMSEKDIIKLDMSEYAERHTVSALVGSPAGYVGYGKGGGLTEKVRRKPQSNLSIEI
jgi:ATP-dependent Clp protease ATP-binding subunit ClpC